LVTAKLYHPAWPLVAGHSLLVGGTTLFSMLGILITGLTGEGSVCLLLTASFVVAQLSNLGLLAWIEQATVPAPDRQREIVETTRQLPRQLLLVTLTQLVHSWAAIRATFARSVTWRKISYRLERESVRLLYYKPFEDCHDPKQSIF
jgi:hypothetical protein